MAVDERILDALARWTAARERGEDLSVEALCHNFPDLAEEVRARIAMLARMNWLEHSADDPPREAAAPRPVGNSAEVDTVALNAGVAVRAPRVGATVRYIGDYELLAEIARGGMGVVYKARQVRLKRVVALKMILAGDFATAADVQRFHTEAESAAQLDHPNIVPIFEVGEHQGLHYFSMGFVDGASLAVRLSAGPLAPRAAAEIVRTVAGAVHYAHNKGVIHRDLKPGNILLDRGDQPRVTDFGLAKQTQAGASDLTGTGQILGTPSYMPPEQALGQISQIREPADIYALGAVLYAALTGRPPFQADNPLTTLRMVLEREPVPPRQLNPAIPLDLETICLKCLEKAASRRYGTAQEVADELGRFLEGKPILARPVSTLNRAWRWCKRNRAVAGLLAAVAASLLIGIAVSGYFAVREGIARGKAQESALAANVEAANLALNEAQTHCEKGEANVGLLWMAKAHRLAIEAEDPDLADACRAMISGWLPQVPKLQAVYIESGKAAARFGGSGEIIAVSRKSDEGGILQVLNATTGKLQQKVARVNRPFDFELPISRDGTKILAADDAGQIRFWSLQEGTWIGEPLIFDDTPCSADFSPDGKLLATATIKGTVQFWDTETSKVQPVIIQQAQINLPLACRVRFHRDGQSLWTTGSGRRLAQHKVSDGSLVQPVVALKDAVWSLTLSPDYSLLAVGYTSKGIEFFRTNQQPPQSVGGGPSILNYEIAFRPDGTHLLAGGRGHQNGARFWNAKTYEPEGSWLTTPNVVTSAQLSRDGRQGLICTSTAVEAWEQPAVMESRTQGFRRKGNSNVCAYCPRKMQHISSTERDGRYVTVRDVNTDGKVAEIGPLPAPVAFLKANPDGTSAIGVTSENHVFFADLIAKSFRVAAEKTVGTPLSAAISSDGCSAFLVLVSDGAPSRKTVQLWSVTRADQVPLNPDPGTCFGGRAVAFSPRGDVLIVAAKQAFAKQQIHLYDTADGCQLTPVMDSSPGPIACIGYLPDGNRLLVANYGTMEVWDISTRMRIHVLGSHDTMIAGFVISQDGRFAASWGDDRAIRIWNLETGKLQGSPIRNFGATTALAFSSDSRLLAAHSRESETRLFHVPTGRMIAGQMEPASNNSENCVEFIGKSDDLFLAVYTLSLHRIFRFPVVPEQHEPLQLLVESTTGLALQGRDVRILPRAEWQKRHDRLAAHGWKDPVPEVDVVVLQSDAAKLLEQSVEIMRQKKGEQQALPLLEQALTLQKYAVAQDPANPAAQALLGEIHASIGKERYEANPKPLADHVALADVQLAIQAYERAVAHPTAKVEWAAKLASAEGKAGVFTGDLRRLHKAQDRLLEFESRFGEHIEFKQVKGSQLGHLAYMDLRSNPAHALSLYDDSRRLMSEVFAATGKPEVADFIGRSLANQIYVVLTFPAEDPRRKAVRAATPKVIETLEQVCLEHPEVPAYAVGLAAVLQNYADFDYLEAQHSSAAATLEHSGDLLAERMDRKQPIERKSGRIYQCYQQAAFCYARADEEFHWRKAIDLAAKVQERYRTRNNKEGSFADAENGVAVARLRLGDPAGALIAIEKAIEIRKTPHACDLFWRSAIHDKLGEKGKADADWKAAEEWMAANPTFQPLVISRDKQVAGAFRTPAP